MSVARAIRAAVTAGLSLAVVSAGLAAGPAGAAPLSSGTPTQTSAAPSLNLVAAAKPKAKRATRVNLNLRTGPSRRYRVIRVLPKGTVVTLTGRRSGAYVRVKVRSRTGWVASRYLRAIPRTPAPRPRNTRTVRASITGYTWWDNSPPGSAAIARPVIHRRAGGVGTYRDPITMAVGYTSRGMDIPAGTRFYLPKLRKYFIVEDKCGACHRHSANVAYKLDIWLDGRNRSRSSARSCAYRNTSKQSVIRNPPSGLPVRRGSVC